MQNCLITISFLFIKVIGLTILRFLISQYWYCCDNIDDNFNIAKCIADAYNTKYRKWYRRYFKSKKSISNTDTSIVRFFNYDYHDSFINAQLK